MPGKGTLERVTGIEPAWKAWKASALPLSYAREIWLPVTASGAELPEVQSPSAVVLHVLLGGVRLIDALRPRQCQTTRCADG